MTNMWAQTNIYRSKASFNIFITAKVRIKEFGCVKNILSFLQNNHNMTKDSYTENVIFMLHNFLKFANNFLKNPVHT